MNKERTSYRPPVISKLHRDWGATCYASDLDFVLVESVDCKPKGLFEYKERSLLWNNPQSIKMKMEEFRNDYNVKSNRGLADCAKIPFFLVFTKLELGYTGEQLPEEEREFAVLAINSFAIEFLKGKTHGILTELGYVYMIYKLRGETIPPEVEIKLRKINRRKKIDEQLETL